VGLIQPGISPPLLKQPLELPGLVLPWSVRQGLSADSDDCLNNEAGERQTDLTCLLRAEVSLTLAQADMPGSDCPCQYLLDVDECFFAASIQQSANPKIHYETTVPKSVSTDGDFGVFVVERWKQAYAHGSWTILKQ